MAFTPITENAGVTGIQLGAKQASDKYAVDADLRAKQQKLWSDMMIHAATINAADSLNGPIGNDLAKKAYGMMPRDYESVYDPNGTLTGAGPVWGSAYQDPDYNDSRMAQIAKQSMAQKSPKPPGPWINPNVTPLQMMVGGLNAARQISTSGLGLWPWLSIPKI